jgi:hypothetical protein
MVTGRDRSPAKRLRGREEPRDRVSYDNGKRRRMCCEFAETSQRAPEGVKHLSRKRPDPKAVPSS